MMIRPLGEELNQSFDIIKQYQTGELKLIKTERPWFDNDGGVLPQSMMLLAGASFGGKTTEMERLKKGIMNKDTNPKADNFAWMSNSFEMTNFMTTLRDLKGLLQKSHTEILNKEFNEEEKERVNEYYKNKADGRFFVNHVPMSAKAIVDNARKFLETHSDKDLVVIDIDHVALTRAAQEGKKIAIDDLIEGLNELKNEFKNSMFVIVSQLNRGILGRLKEKSNESAIQRGDIYQSDSIYQTCDYVIGLQNASQLGVEEYRKVYPDKYGHLEHRFTEEDSKGRVSLLTDGCIFIEYMKNRLADYGYTDLFTIEIKPPDRSKVTRKVAPPEFDIPKEAEEPEYDPFEDL